jgi:hypothetical protein
LIAVDADTCGQAPSFLVRYYGGEVDNIDFYTKRDTDYLQVPCDRIFEINRICLNNDLWRHPEAEFLRWTRESLERGGPGGICVLNAGHPRIRFEEPRY